MSYELHTSGEYFNGLREGRKQGALEELELLTKFIKEYESIFDEVINVKNFILGRISELKKVGCLSL